MICFADFVVKQNLKKIIMFKENTYSYHQISTAKYKYVMSIMTMYNKYGNPISYGINIEGKMKGCVTITVEAQNPEIDERFVKFKDDKKLAFISWVGYNRKCSITEDLPSGVGTRHMIKTAMTVVCSKYPWIEGFSLTDASEVTCKEGLVVSLAALSLVINGKTYYEKYFKAFLKRDDIRNEYEKQKTLLIDSTKKIETKLFLKTFQIPDNQLSFVRDIYDKSSTYLEFFQDLQKYCKSNNLVFCEVVYSWLDLFLRHILGSPEEYWMSKWIISKSNIQTMEIQKWDDNIKIQDIKSILQEEFKKHQSGGYTSGSFVLGDLE